MRWQDFYVGVEMTINIFDVLILVGEIAIHYKQIIAKVLKKC